MKKIFNGGLGICVVLKETSNIKIVCAIDEKYNPFAVVEDYDEDYAYWQRAGYYSNLDEAIQDYDKRVIQIQIKVRGNQDDKY